MYRDQSREYRLVIVSRSIETFLGGAVGKRNFGIGGRGGWAQLLREMSSATKIRKSGVVNTSRGKATKMYTDQSREYRSVLMSRSRETLGEGAEWGGVCPMAA